MKLPSHTPAAGDPDQSLVDRLLPRQLIVTFHGLGEPERKVDEDEAPYWLAPDVLARTIELAARRSFEITFDDGNLSDHAIALPMLADAGLPATFFVLAGRLGQPGSLGGAEIRQMATAGMTIGSHGHDHVPWTRADDSQMRRELQDARAKIEDSLGVPVDTISAPFGDCDARVLRLIAEAGYRHLFTSSNTLCARSAWLQPRHTIQQGTDVERDIPRWLSWQTRITSGLRNELRGRRLGLSTSMAVPGR
jgi:peptidoglycan/xylan/chitin deacetylase (PgdA/CDA1 family)